MNAIPDDRPVRGIHVVAFLDAEHIVLAWDGPERLLTTIGGQREAGETLDQTLDREAREEAGLDVCDERIPFAAYLWPDTDTYTVFVVARVRSLARPPGGYEKTGRVVCTVETACEIVRVIEPMPDDRLRVLAWAGEAARAGGIAGAA